MKLLLVGLGPIGQQVARELHSRGLGELAAAVDTDPELVGRDVSELVPEVPAGTRVEASLPEAARDAAVVTTSSSLERCAPTFRELLARGDTVVSTCEELSWPYLRHARLAQELDEYARARGGRLLGTGVNPGFLMDALPVALTAVSRRVDRVDVWRIQDATSRRVPFQRKIGAGLDPEAFAARAEDGSLRHVGLGESLHFVAHHLGLRFDVWSETLEPVLAEEELECALGTIRPGDARGVSQVATGKRGGETVCRLEFRAAIGEPDPHDRVRVDGEPPLDVRLEGGVHGDVATVAITLNAIPSLAAAPPGLHTMATVPPVHWHP